MLSHPVPNVIDFFNAEDKTYVLNENYEKKIQPITEEINNSLINWPQLYVRRGNLYLYQADFTKAMADAEAAVSYAFRDFTIFTAYLFRGNIHYAMQNYEKAIEDYEHALSKAPDLSSEHEGCIAVGHYNLMYAHYKNNQIALAINALGKALCLRGILNKVSKTRRTNANNMLKKMLFSINEHTNLDDITTGENLFAVIKRCLSKEDQIFFLQQSIIPTTPFGKKMHHLQKEILEYFATLSCEVFAFHHANVSVTTVGMYSGLTATSKSKIKKITSDELFDHSSASTAHGLL